MIKNALIFSFIVCGYAQLVCASNASLTLDVSIHINDFHHSAKLDTNLGKNSILTRSPYKIEVNPSKVLYQSVDGRPAILVEFKITEPKGSGKNFAMPQIVALNDQGAKLEIRSPNGSETIYLEIKPHLK